MADWRHMLHFTIARVMSLPCELTCSPHKAASSERRRIINVRGFRFLTGALNQGSVRLEQGGTEHWVECRDGSDPTQRAAGFPRRYDSERYRLSDGEAHWQGFRDRRQLRCGSVEGIHLSSGPTDGDDHQHPVHLVPERKVSF